ncbi:heme exporter protein CcmD [Yoonia sp. R2331]
MPDLGKYAVEVLAAYGVSLTLLVLIVWLSVRRSRAVKAALEKVEHG